MESVNPTVDVHPLPASEPVRSRVPTHHAHIPSLDGLRGLAILMVLFIHTSVNFGHAGVSTIDRIYQHSLLAGWCGVDLFFVLSGFLITGILYDSRQRVRYFYNFYGRRLLRIFPLYYAFLLVITILLPLGRRSVGRSSGDVIPSVWCWLYLQNYVTAIRGKWANGNMLDITWSLAIEEQFYLVWPLLVWLLNRRAMMWLCAAMVIAIPVVREALLSHGINPRAIYVFTPTRIDGLAVGAWIALAMRSSANGKVLQRVGAVAGILAFCTVAGLWITQGGFIETNHKIQVYGYSAVAVLFGSIIIAATTPAIRNPIAAFFSTPILRFFGRYSYGLYLLHLPVLGFVRDGLFRRFGNHKVLGMELPMLLAFQLTVIGLTVVAALISWNLFEKRFLSLKKYFSDRPKPHALPAIAATN